MSYQGEDKLVRVLVASIFVEDSLEEDTENEKILKWVIQLGLNNWILILNVKFSFWARKDANQNHIWTNQF